MKSLITDFQSYTIWLWKILKVYKLTDDDQDFRINGGKLGFVVMVGLQNAILWKNLLKWLRRVFIKSHIYCGTDFKICAGTHLSFLHICTWSRQFPRHSTLFWKVTIVVWYSFWGAKLCFRFSCQNVDSRYIANVDPSSRFQKIYRSTMKVLKVNKFMNDDQEARIHRTQTNCCTVTCLGEALLRKTSPFHYNTAS